jgi:hypothetical protein
MCISQGRIRALKAMAVNVRDVKGVNANYKILNKLGAGSFGVVTKVQRLKDGKMSLPDVFLRRTTGRVELTPHGQKKPDSNCRSSSCKNGTRVTGSRENIFFLYLHFFYSVSIFPPFLLSLLLSSFFYFSCTRTYFLLVFGLFWPEGG